MLKKKSNVEFDFKTIQYRTVKMFGHLICHYSFLRSIVEGKKRGRADLYEVIEIK